MDPFWSYGSWDFGLGERQTSTTIVDIVCKSVGRLTAVTDFQEWDDIIESLYFYLYLQSIVIANT